MMKRFTFSLAVATFMLLGYSQAKADNWIHQPATACVISTDSQVVKPSTDTLGTSQAYVGRLQSNSTTYHPKIYCPIVDTSYVNVGDSTQFYATSVQVYVPSTTPALAQDCTDYQGSTGGSCDSAQYSGSSAGSWGINTGVSNWQTYWSDYHYLWVELPQSSGSNGSYFEGFTVF